jgi:hypothetical protein
VVWEDIRDIVGRDERENIDLTARYGWDEIDNANILRRTFMF